VQVDHYSYNLYLHGLLITDRHQQAAEFFQEMKTDGYVNAHSYNLWIHSYCRWRMLQKVGLLGKSVLVIFFFFLAFSLCRLLFQYFDTARRL
jgi:pentatricopeptide repeat protein